MAPSAGRIKRRTLVCIVLTLFVVLMQFVPFSNASIPRAFKLYVPNNVPVGYMVTKLHFPEECVDITPVSSGTEFPVPFTVQSDGKLVTDKPLTNLARQVYTVTPKSASQSSSNCLNIARYFSSASKRVLTVVIVEPSKVLSFPRDLYTFSIDEFSPRGSVVSGLQDVYACLEHQCKGEVQYLLYGDGSNDFAIDTVVKEAQTSVLLRTKQTRLNQVYFLTLVSKNRQGARGQTNIWITLRHSEEHIDGPLKYIPENQRKLNHRYRRQSVTQTVDIPEGQTGRLFSVAGSSPTSWVYSLDSSTMQNVFEVKPDGFVHLVTGQKLDYDTLTVAQRAVTLGIEAKDSSGTVMKTTTVTVNILNVNDEMPVITNIPTPLLTTVSPNAAIGTLVFTISASDADPGAVLSFTQTSETANFALSQNGNTAEIRTRQTNCVLNQDYDVFVTVADTTAPLTNPQSTRTTVSIKCGDRKPQFLQDKYVYGFQENNIVGQTITGSKPLRVISFQKAPVTYSIWESNGQVSQRFAIDNNGNIIVNEIMDYESSTGLRNFVLEVRARETAVLTTDVPVEINLTNLNEYSPIFGKSTYQRTKAEDVSVGTSVFQVNVIDQDYGTVLTFSVSDDHFRIVPDPNPTGQTSTATIYVAKALDYDRITPKQYDMEIKAIDNGPIPLSGSTKARVFVTNVNDERPVVPNVTTSMHADTPSNTAIFTVRATDADERDRITYSISGSQSRFQINAHSGIIELVQQLPSPATQFQYQLIVLATDDGHCCPGTTPVPPHTSSGTVTINVITDNVYRPTFTNCKSYNTAILEGNSGTSVTTVSASDQDIGKNGNVTYSLANRNIDASNPYANAFTVNATTGHIFTNMAIDRESLQATTTLAITAIAKDGGGLQSTCSFLVTINDDNDNDPSFGTADYDTSVVKTALNNSLVTQIAATDLDLGNNAMLNYSLVFPSTAYFGIQIRTGKITVKESLAALVAGTKIEFQLIATDNGVPPRNTSLDVTFTIIADSSLSPPVWNQTIIYTLDLVETVAVGTYLVGLEASTGDASDSISYNIGGAGAVYNKNLFQIVYEQGTQKAYLSLKRSLDYERDTQHIISVLAGVTNARSSIQVITLKLEDANDEYPYFENTDALGFIHFSIVENDDSFANHLVGGVQANDPDKEAPNNQIKEYRLIGIEDYKHFSINSQTGELFTNATALDRETKGQYIITVAAIDNAPSAITAGPEGNTGRAKVKIDILDVNDNSPYFDQSVYAVSVNEDKLIGYVVTTLTAQDDDISDVLRYSLTVTGLPFSIQPDTGDIQVADALDYEDPTGREYSVVVQVFDGIHNNTCRVNITVKDVNDNPPTVTEIPTFINISEAFDPTKEPGGRFPLATVTATDPDNNGVNTFYYSLTFTRPGDDQLFDIDANGRLYLLKSLDRDLPNGRPEYTFTVNVQDSITKPLVGYSEVSFRPVDVNDNSPIFLAEGSLMSVTENSEKGTQVGKLLVIDYDEGINAEIDIAIMQQIPSRGAFTLGASKDYLITNNTLDRESISNYTVRVRATDKGKPSTPPGYGNVLVNVLDENDNLPHFVKSEYFFIVSEAQKYGSFARLYSVDPDEPQNAERTYLLDDDALTNFRITTDPGENGDGILSVFKALDFDKNQTTVSFNVQVTDRGQVANLNSTKVTITVTDYNDEKPIFSPTSETVRLLESAPVGTSVTTFTATDADINADDSRISYAISSQTDPFNQFRIDRETGRVTLKNSLDRETIDVHLVHILAIDAGTPQQTGTASLTVTVLDINDNYPDFAQAYQPVVTENKVYAGASILNVAFIDADLSPDGEQFGFELNCGNNNPGCRKFRLQRIPGKQEANLIVTGVFDRENQSRIDLPVKLWDYPNNLTYSQNGIRHLFVNVADVNDNPHFDASTEILVYNYKGKFGNFVIGRVPVTDKDEDNLDKTYELLDPQIAGKLVSVDARSGEITLRANVPEMIFTFRARVSGLWEGQTRLKTSSVTVNHVFIPEDAVYNSGAIRVKGLTAKELVAKDSAGKTKYNTLRKAMAVAFKTDWANVQLLSVITGPDGSYTDIRYAAHGSPYYQAGRLDGAVQVHMAKMQEIVCKNGSDYCITVPIDMCQNETCEGGCFNKLQVYDTPVMVNSNTESFVGVNVTVVHACGCRAKDNSGAIGCTPSYCNHGGECVQDDWKVVSCTCPEGYDGPRCQQLRQSFNGTGYALYKQLEQCENSRTSIEILTTNPNGIILYNGPTSKLKQTDPEDFLLLDLQNGSPRLQINHGSGTLTLEFPTGGTPNVVDNKWHRIDIIRTKKVLQLVVDRCVTSTGTGNCEVTGVTPGGNYYLNVASLLHVGGVAAAPPSDSGLEINFVDRKFDGCVRNLRHNTELYDLSTEGAFPGAQDGCKREDDRCPKGCGDNGQCEIQTAGQAACICDPGFMDDGNSKCTKETPEVDLGTSSYIDWIMKQAFFQQLNDRRTVVSLMYRSRDTSGVLYHLTGELYNNNGVSEQTYITIKILDDVLSVAYNLGKSQNTLAISQTVPASDGQWHFLRMERYGKEVVIQVDSGEGRYYAETQGPADGNQQITLRQSQVYSGAHLTYNINTGPTVAIEDLTSSCIKDIRFEKSWFPMSVPTSGQSTAATFDSQSNIDYNCSRPNDCVQTTCPDTKICVPLWGDSKCVCPPHFVEVVQVCEHIDYCRSSPCFGSAQCVDTNPCLQKDPGTCSATVDTSKNYFMCQCSGGWYGDLCQCHTALNSAGPACVIVIPPEERTALAGGVIAGIIIGILLLIILVVLLVFFVCRRKPSKPPLLDDDSDDDIRENVMYYDEEGAGEEDQTGYDLNRLRKPDDGEYPGTLDITDIPRSHNKPLLNSERPDIGDFIGGRLDDANDDPDGSPDDTPIDFNFEGEGSIATSLSSLNTSSTGDQDYNYLNDWGPKFAKLADMYNDYEDDED